MPLHLQKAYKYLGYEAGDFPVSETVAPEILSLPMFPQLTAEQQKRVLAQVLQFLPTSTAHRTGAIALSYAAN